MEEKKEKAKKRKKAKKKFVDDGHTVYSMEGLGDRRAPKKSDVSLTRKERWAAIRAAMSVYLPRILLVLACFAVAVVLVYFWLR